MYLIVEDVFLDKPIEPNALVDTIQEILGERREEPEHPIQSLVVIARSYGALRDE